MQPIDTTGQQTGANHCFPLSTHCSWTRQGKISIRYWYFLVWHYTFIQSFSRRNIWTVNDRTTCISQYYKTLMSENGPLLNWPTSNQRVTLTPERGPYIYLDGRSWTVPSELWLSAQGRAPCRSCPGWGSPPAYGGGRSYSAQEAPWSYCTPTTVARGKTNYEWWWLLG